MLTILVCKGRIKPEEAYVETRRRAWKSAESGREKRIGGHAGPGAIHHAISSVMFEALVTGDRVFQHINGHH
ncbi:hypothetical protein [Arthrobacter ramosus]|uniref:Uncharacterized protein n=1 Tax=Arthrobacter ramosus TaxID=1672 RepID=A0ABV5XZB5_ARTRM|nr:hypothetical protein [Arthrobacter ramosus]